MIETICCGFNHTLILKSDGELIGFGINSEGQLGTGNKQHQYKPVFILKDPKIKQVSSSVSSSMILKEDEEVWVWGKNDCGKLGTGNKEDQHKPVLMMKNENIFSINGGRRVLIWSPEDHKYFSSSFQQRILLFLLFLKRNQSQTGLKIPKPVIHEIIKRSF